jgi:hypothetical protein
MKTRVLLIIMAVCLSVLLVGSPALAYVTKQIDKMSPKLSGLEEVGPNASTATGQLIIKVNQDATSMHYKLNVNNLADITASHIHLAPKGVNGPVVVFLYPGPQIPGLFSGVLAEGDFTAANLVGPLAGHPLSDLDIEMDALNTYVNVHTTTYPGGKIRGQIIPLNSFPGLSNLSIILMLGGFSAAIAFVVWRRKLAYQRR